MIDKLKKSECCGCNACGDICPKGSITFQTDDEGFLYPVIDHQSCIECGLCEKVCPSVNSEELKKNDFDKPVCFAAVHKNLEVRFDSTSGGAFSALAKKAYLQHYYVGGAIWDDDWSVSHFISDNKNDLEKLRSSKYIQSDARGLYKEIKGLLERDEKVLICGTPCQIAGLKSFLRKDYDNLITVDFICQYVNSPFIWKKYIDYLEQEHKSKVVYIKDKNKEIGWRTLCNKVVFENGDVIYDTKEENHFRRCYMKLGIASRPSCYECKFKGFPRIADITIADFWGGEKYLPEGFDNDLGTSLIMCNSRKGLDYFDDGVRKYLNVIDTKLENTLRGNKALTVSFHPTINFSREQFYSDLRKSDIKTVVDEYIAKPFSPKILVARVQAILRRSAADNTDDSILEAGCIRIDKSAHQVYVDDSPVDLSYKEFELLTFFVENIGIALSREKILNNVWDYDYFGEARTIDTHVKKLRAKLGTKAGDMIKTIWGMGYKFEV